MFYLDSGPKVTKNDELFPGIRNTQGPLYHLFIDIAWVINWPFEKVGCLLLLVAIE